MLKQISIEIKWAVIFIIMTLLWMLLERLVGLHDIYIDKHPIFTNIIAIPAIAVYVLALRNKRKSYYNGKMTYMQGFISGLIITFIVTVLSPVTQIITSYVITPHYFSNVINYSVTNGLMNQEAAEAYFNIKSYIIQGLMGASIMGTITAAIVAIFARKA